MKKGSNIELRNDEVRDILQRMPHWAIRWGITIIFAAIAFLLFFSYLYRYPDLIRSEVVVSASNPPALLKARTSGKIVMLAANEGDPVEMGRVLATIENPANSDDVEQLNLLLGSHFDQHSVERFYDVATFNAFELGEIQVFYADFIQQVNTYRQFVEQPLHEQKIEAALQRLEMQRVFYDRLWSQRRLMEAELQLAQKSFARDSMLYERGVISLSDFENMQKEWIAQQLQFETIRTQLASTQAGIYELEQEISELKIVLAERENNLKQAIIRSYELLSNSIETWKVKYQLISPIDGRLSMDKVWAVNQNVSEGETVMTVVPDKPLLIRAMSYIPTRGAGKVKPGQRVNIKLNNYPYMQYGMLTGQVKSVAPVPVNKAYAVEISLSEKLLTSYGIQLEMQQELTGNCEIITDDLRLIQRMIYPVKALIEKNKR
ncbi:HlyD family secretion protein [Roseimarinus sediminis]|jgi:HlyD family secretion protein|uniref:HlyD family secretion protein n=1 Tax=Roseimarinus sediminis TaxID=1610899 RepID=UPI003D20D75A